MKKDNEPAKVPPAGMIEEDSSSDEKDVQMPSRTEEVPKSGGGSSIASTEDSMYSIKSPDSDYSDEPVLTADPKTDRIISKYPPCEDNINVVVRVRPITDKDNNSPCIIKFPGNGQIIVEGASSSSTNSTNSSAQKGKQLAYNVVFETGATQEDVLQYSGITRLIEMAVEGFNCTCFCYGQTGSGKTHTLTGPPGLFKGKGTVYSDEHGLIFRSFLHLFNLLKTRTESHFVLKASFLEIYNEKVIDLLNAGSCRKPLSIRWSKKTRSFAVENLFTVDCDELDDLTAVLEEGMRNRSVGRHSMNDHSSRSHTILTVYISSELPAEDNVYISRQGKINFVDLAGSEMTKKTHSEGKTLEEANNINKSLMVLGYCIASLSDPRRKNGHVPYRDSKLTKLLADSLAGNGVTLMIACISPTRANYSETLNTLRYAARAKRITMKPVVLMDPREALILNLKRDIEVLKKENEYLKSTLRKATDVIDLNAAFGDAVEKVTLPTFKEDELNQLDESQLAKLAKLYMSENEELRRENENLYNTREKIVRDQEFVCRENERLIKKLEEVHLT